MADASDLLAAELAAIRELVAERGRLLALVMNLDAAGRDVGRLEAAERGLAAWAPRLLAAVEAALEAVARWKRQSTTGRDASAIHADELQQVLEAALLGEGESHGSAQA